LSGCLERLAEYYQAMGTDHVILQGVPWVVYQRMVVPRGPACRDYTISRGQQQSLLSHFKKAVLVQYTDGFHAPAENAPWYAVTCRRCFNMEDFNSHFRNKLRKGLNLCTVCKVDAEFIAARGYEVYMAAYERYTNTAAPDISESRWRNNVLANRNYPDLREYWAVLVGQELAGFAANMLFGTIEANYSMIKLHPKFLKAYSSYALHFCMNRHYLREQSFQYVNSGFRTIGHDTNIEQLRTDYFGFQRTPTNLYLRYRPSVSAALLMPRFAKRWLGKLVPQYASLCALDEARTRTTS
jgi:hypothetical protein